MRHYYAAHMPRGFSNEVNTYRFTSRKARDQFIRETNDGEERPERWAKTITAREALANVRDQGDAATQNYNSGYIDA
jgi:hypothetical protein